MSSSIIDIEPYEHQLILFHGSSVDEMGEFLQKVNNISKKDIKYFLKGIEDVNGRAYACKNGGCILYVADGLNDPELISTVTHECFHITTFVLDRVGIKFNFKTDEAYAYLLSNIVVKCFNVIFSNELTE